MMHAFSAHYEDILSCVEEADEEPDRCNPAPLHLLSGGRVHRENRIPPGWLVAKNAANCRWYAARGLAKRRNGEQSCPHDQQSAFRTAQRDCSNVSSLFTRVCACGGDRRPGVYQRWSDEIA